jgi:circadian clock protein KaiB
MRPTGFGAEVETSGTETVIRLRGDLEDASAARARAAFEQALAQSPQQLMIDLSQLEFMDSTGVWLVVEAHRRCVDSGIQLRLEGTPRPAVAQALALSGVEGLLSASGREPAETREHEIALRLYVSSRSPGSGAVARAVGALTDRLPGAAVEVEVIDVFEEPVRAKQDRVIATPTLIKLRPAPELRLIGSIADPEAVLHHLGLGHLMD